MKIAYVLEVNPYINSGIIKKVNNQINYWRHKENEVFLLIVWPKPVNNGGIYIKGKVFFHEVLKNLNDGFVKNYLNKILSAKKLSSELEQIQPDILYIRQNIWYPNIHNILKKYNTVLEINTVDTIEIKHYSKLKVLIYNLGRKKILQNVKAIVAVSPSILTHYTKYDILSKVVSNGINLSQIEKVKKPNKLGNVNFVFVGSSDMKWHGVDKIIEMARAFNEYFFNIVGYTNDYFPNSPENVKFYGWVEADELKRIYSKCHFGLGSFSNHLVGKKIDSTLKVREYLAYGLPVLLGHNDVDFTGEKFVFKITDDKGNFIDKEKIKKFIEENKSLVVDNRDLLIIDSSTKEEERLGFFNIIASKS